MYEIVAATLLGPQDPVWPYCKQKASEWAAKHIILEDSNAEVWGNEAGWRKRLWDMALAAASDPEDWIFILDSDFVVAGDPRMLALATGVVEWRFNLYDLWERRVAGEGLTHWYSWWYRCDGFWQAHNNPRPWMFKAGWMRDRPWQPERGIHSGHSPPHNGNFGVAPKTHVILHLGWLPQVRREKYDRYMSISDQLTDSEKAHVESIITTPTLKELSHDLSCYLGGLALPGSEE